MITTLKNKLLFTYTLTLLIIGLVAVGCYLFLSKPTDKTTATIRIETVETARLSLDGTNVKILASVNDFSTSRNFIFQNLQSGDTITTLSVSSLGLETPSYQIIKGVKHDWLVINKVETWGTGFRQDVDEWYITSSQGKAKLVLSYPAQTLQVPNSSNKNEYTETEILKITDDSNVAIKTVQKLCSVKEDGTDKDCKESPTTNHYIWSEEKEEFELK
jgi:hypothetical protein